jgi:tryptophan-rich hypothetical protein
MKGKQQLFFPHLVGSKWTATQSIQGWRHYQVHAREDRKPFTFALMRSVVDEKVQFWVNAKVLKDRSQWEAGWKEIVLGEPCPVVGRQEEALDELNERSTIQSVTEP